MKSRASSKEFSDGAWIVTVDMGYGHERASRPLLHLAPDGESIRANSYEGMPSEDQEIWDQSESFYYLVSRMKSKGMLGRFLFGLFDRYQKIDEQYPLRRMESPSLQLQKIYRQIRGGWGKDLVEKLSKTPRPILTTFFTMAHMAEYWKYPGEIFTLVTDSDASRAWAPYNPRKSPIRYFAPTTRVAERLRSYGVREDHITFTGFPLPQELVGSRSSIAKRNLLIRLPSLDPSGRHISHYAPLLRISKNHLPSDGHRPPEIAFAIGGAGAQAEIGVTIMKSLAPHLRSGKLILHLVAGVSGRASDKFHGAVRKYRLQRYLGTTINILFCEKKEEYFAKFNELLTHLHILWTKPSELSFYGALGIPIIIAPPIGSQEIQNRKWLLEIGAGIDQFSPAKAGDWLPSLIEKGRFAEAAMRGFIEMEREGTKHITKIIREAY